MPYSSVESMLLGDMGVGPDVDKENFVEDAANEIDSKIGHIYETPLNLAAGGLARHSALLVTKISNHLATGRLILALGIGGEEDDLHAYGIYLVREALADLDRIATGLVSLTGAVPVTGTTLPSGTDTAPAVINKDETSPVDAFYDDMMRVPTFAATAKRPIWQHGSP